MNNYRRILSPGEMAEIIDALDRLVAIYDALGFPEDANSYRGFIARLEKPEPKKDG